MGGKTHLHTAGRKSTPTFNSWVAMRQRCYYPKHWKYHRYGGRGITVCARWRNSFANFLADMGPRPPGKSGIDRKDNDGNYTPTNCRWATAKEQTENRTKESFGNRSAWTHCRKGHAYSSANTYRNPQGVRRCRACARAGHLARRAKRPPKPVKVAKPPRTHCSKGHQLSGRNIIFYTARGKRYVGCRICANVRAWRSHKRLRAERRAALGERA